jgi:hypothetical protein
MSPATAQVIVGMFGAFGGILGGLAIFRQARDARSASLIDDFAEELARERAARLAAEAKFERRLDASLRRERVRDDYIAALRQDIADGKGPPPRPWPAGLLVPGPDHH